MHIRNTYLLVFSYGIVTAFVFSHPALWPLALIAFAFFIRELKNTTSPKKGAILGGLYAAPFMAGSLLWWFGSFPLTSSGISAPITSAVLLTITWVIVSATLTLSSVSFGALFVALKKNILGDIVLLACLWTLSEILRAAAFFILTLSPEALLGPHWTFGYSGYILSGSPLLLQLSSFGGVYLLGFVFALLGGALVYIPLSISKRLLLVPILFILLYISFPTSKTLEEPTLRVAALKTTETSYFSSQNIDRRARLDRINELIEKVSEVHLNTDLIVTPEDSRFIALQSDVQLQNIQLHNAYILDSSRVQLPREKAYSKMMTYSHNEGVSAQYAKRLLVPESEYLSYAYTSLLRLFGLDDKVQNFSNVKAYGAGPAYEPTHAGKDLPIAASLCSEIYSPHIQQKLAKDTGLLINMGSHSRLQGSDILFNQVLAMSKVRAAENGKYLVRATNFDDSFVVSNTGKVVAMTNSGKPFDFIYYEVPLLYERTLFSRAPYAVPILSVIVVLIFVVRRRHIRS